MFEIKNVSKAYEKGGKKAVDGINLTVNNGEIFGFLGPNGAGKTTTIKMLTGILQPDEGDLLLDDISILERPIAAKRQFAFVPDNPETFSRLRGIEYLNFIADVYKVSTEDRKTRIDFYCEKFGLSGVLNNRISSFSHGMKQKLFLIASLISDPENWILDEPMVGLDPEAAFTVKELMRQRADQGHAVFFSTHVMEVAEKICDRVGIIKEGQIVFVGSIEELKEEHQMEGQSLEDIFLRLVAGDFSENGGAAGAEENVCAQGKSEAEENVYTKGKSEDSGKFGDDR